MAKRQPGGGLASMITDLGIPLSFVLAHQGLKGSLSGKKPASNMVSRAVRSVVGGNHAQEVVGYPENLQGAPLQVDSAPAPAPAPASAPAHAPAPASSVGGKCNQKYNGGGKKKTVANKKKPAANKKKPVAKKN
jgi:hypothetical protein